MRVAMSVLCSFHPKKRASLWLLGCVGCGLLVGAVASAELLTPKSAKPATKPAPRQPQRLEYPPRLPDSSPDKTGQSKPAAGAKSELEIEVLILKRGNVLDAQTWGRTFESIGRSARLRQPMGNEAGSITESESKGVRRVKIVGELDANGRVVIQGKAFDSSQTKQLKDYLDEIAKFGVQGAPDGKPIWGLNREQFTETFETLGAAITEPTKGKTWKELASLFSAEKSPLKFSEGVQSTLSESSLTLQNEVRGLSRGTATALALSEFGHGFAPVRTPTGKVELRVSPLKDLPQPWPIGWPIDPEISRDQVFPELFAFDTIEFTNVPLSEFFPAIETRAGLPILVDYRRCADMKLDLTAEKVTFKRQKTFWASLLGQAANPHFLKEEYRQDERGRGIVYIVPVPRGGATP